MAAFLVKLWFCKRIFHKVASHHGVSWPGLWFYLTFNVLSGVRIKAGRARCTGNSCNLRITVSCWWYFCPVMLIATGVVCIITVDGESICLRHWLIRKWSRCIFKHGGHAGSQMSFAHVELRAPLFQSNWWRKSPRAFIRGLGMTVPNQAEERSLLCCQTTGVFLAMC